MEHFIDNDDDTDEPYDRCPLCAALVGAVITIAAGGLLGIGAVTAAHIWSYVFG